MLSLLQTRERAVGAALVRGTLTISYLPNKALYSVWARTVEKDVANNCFCEQDHDELVTSVRNFEQFFTLGDDQNVTPDALRQLQTVDKLMKAQNLNGLPFGGCLNVTAKHRVTPTSKIDDHELINCVEAGLWTEANRTNDNHDQIVSWAFTDKPVMQCAPAEIEEALLASLQHIVKTATKPTAAREIEGICPR